MRAYGAGCAQTLPSGPSLLRHLAVGRVPPNDVSEVSDRRARSVSGRQLGSVDTTDTHATDETGHNATTTIFFKHVTPRIEVSLIVWLHHVINYITAKNGPSLKTPMEHPTCKCLIWEGGAGDRRRPCMVFRPQRSQRCAYTFRHTGKVFGRADWVRTSDLLLPKQTRYQASLQLEIVPIVRLELTLDGS